MKILSRFREFIDEGTIISRPNILATGLIGAPAHVLFYFLYKYWFPLPYDNLALRLTASLMCLSVLFRARLPESLQPYFPLQWHIVIAFSLPFIFTVHLIMNNFPDLWLDSEICMVFILIMFVPHWVMFLFDLSTGVLGAILFCVIAKPHLLLNPAFNIPHYTIVILFSIVAGSAFSFVNLKSIKAEQKRKAEEKNLALQALAGSIAHEMRNPLGQIRLYLNEIKQELHRNSFDSTEPATKGKYSESISRRLAQAQLALNRGLHVIDMTLGNFRNEDTSKEDLPPLYAATTIRTAINEYGYASEQERQMIHFESNDDFMFRGNENSYVLVLYNLLVNAFHFLQTTPEARIDIRLEKSKTINRVYVRDSGPGISSENISKIFDPFFTFGRQDGTGLGLAFCKRIMRSFDGDIICNSQEGEFTEFVMSFPVLDKVLIDDYQAKLYAEYQPLFSGKRVLLAGTSPEYLAVIRRHLTPFGIGTDDASDGTQALNMIQSNRYDLLITDIDLPMLNATELTQKIKELGKDIPVIAYTSSKHPVPGNILLDTYDIDMWISMPPALSELLFALKTSFQTARKNLKKSLNGKTVLVADDLDVNRKLIKSMLTRLGVTILEASNGQEALEKLKTNRCDMLIMDMRMPVLDGMEAAKRIRSETSGYRDIPILGMSGDMDSSSLKIAKQNGMNDCLLKPLKLKEFLQKVSVMLQNDTPVNL